MEIILMLKRLKGCHISFLQQRGVQKAHSARYAGMLPDQSHAESRYRNASCGFYKADPEHVFDLFLK